MKKLFFTSAIGLMLATTAFAQTTKPDRYAQILDIPAPLRKNLRSPTALYLEQYLAQNLIVIRQSGRDKNAIDRQDIQTIQETRERDIRRGQVQQMMVYDRNVDGNVTGDEVLATLTANHQALTQTQMKDDLDRIMAADGNGDGIVTMQEAGDYGLKTMSRYRGAWDEQKNDLEAFLALDPNGDGRLTIEELDHLARKAFNTIDANADGFVSPEEMQNVLLINRDENQAISTSTDCKLPPAAADDKVIVVGTYSGKADSTVSIAGQNAETNVIPLDIQPGATKLYIVVAAGDPLIVQVKGDVNRISQIVVAGPSVAEGLGPNDAGKGKANVGIVGVPIEKVSLRHARTCGLFVLESNQGVKDYTKAAVKMLTGRIPDIVIGGRYVGGFKVFDDRVDEITVSSSNTIPEGFAAEAWQKFLLFKPAGLIDLRNEKIISDVKTEPYEVLPHWAGMAKLIHDGYLVPVQESPSQIAPNAGNARLVALGAHVVQDDPKAKIMMYGRSGFKVVKDVPYYPSGMMGGLSTKFLIAAGVTPPKGVPGHSTVVCEATGRPLTGGSCQ